MDFFLGVIDNIKYLTIIIKFSKFMFSYVWVNISTYFLIEQLIIIAMKVEQNGSQIYDCIGVGSILKFLILLLLGLTITL